VFSTSEDDRPNHHTIVVGQPPLHELLNHRGPPSTIMSFPGSRFNLVTIRLRSPFMILEFSQSVSFRECERTIFGVRPRKRENSYKLFRIGQFPRSLRMNALHRSGKLPGAGFQPQNCI
jgi:hypothetical protein